MRFTAIYVEGDDGCVCVVVEEFPTIVTQGSTLEEARENVLDAVAAVLRASRAEAATCTADRQILLREKLTTPDPDEPLPS